MIEQAVKELHRRRNQLQKEISHLEAEGKKLGHAIKVLTKLSGGSVKAVVKAVKKERRKMSAAGRKAIAAAQKLRWSKVKTKPAKKKRTMSAAARKRIAAFQKARWAKIKAAKKK